MLFLPRIVLRLTGVGEYALRSTNQHQLTKIIASTHSLPTKEETMRFGVQINIS